MNKALSLVHEIFPMVGGKQLSSSVGTTCASYAFNVPAIGECCYAIAALEIFNCKHATAYTCETFTGLYLTLPIVKTHAIYAFRQL